MQESFSYSSTFPLAQSLQAALLTETSHKVDFDSLIRNSLLEALNVNQAYVMRTTFLKNCKEINNVGKLCEMTEQVQDSYKSFSSLMDILHWNPAVRHELKEHTELQRTPFGTHANTFLNYLER